MGSGYRIHLREEMRLENREAFAHIWSDFVAGLTIFLLLIFNPKQVLLLFPSYPEEPVLLYVVQIIHLVTGLRFLLVRSSFCSCYFLLACFSDLTRC